MVVFVALVLVQASRLPTLAIATDADPIQDFCVADGTSTLTVNGLLCKRAADVNLCRGLDRPGNTDTPTANAVTPVFAAQLAGLNMLGVAMASLDFARGGVNVPHIHPRATEVLTVLQGELYVGFVSTGNRLFAATLHAGGVFVLPRGLVMRVQLNVGQGPVVAIAALSSQNSGLQQMGSALFGSGPPVHDQVLQKAFSINQKTVHHIAATSRRE